MGQNLRWERVQLKMSMMYSVYSLKQILTCLAPAVWKYYGVRG